MGNDAAAKCWPGGGGTKVSTPGLSRTAVVRRFQPGGARVGPTTLPSLVSSTSSASSVSVCVPAARRDVRALTYTQLVAASCSRDAGLEYLPSVLVLHPGALRTSPSMTKPLVRSSVMPGMSGYPTRRRSSRMTGIWVCRFLPGVW